MSSINGKFLVIACGGTGGHLFPGIAVAEEWQRRGGEVLLLISEKQIDALAAEGYGHLAFERMPSMAMPRPWSPKMVGFLGRLARSLTRCRQIIRENRAVAVLGMGGFTSAAPLMAGRACGVPTLIHESNSIPGRANRLNARFAKVILVGFADCAPLFGKGKKVAVVGTPLRPSLAQKPGREEGAAFFGLDPAKPTLMVMGGSQGARRVNELVAASLPELAAAGLQVLHISGPGDYDMVRPAYEAQLDAGVVRSFCPDMQYAYAAADLAICRSGASTLTELAHYELPSVLVPYPFSADDHQITNAEIFSRPGAAQMWRQEDLNEANFAGKIIQLIQDDDRMEQMRRQMKTVTIPDASARVCDEIVNHLGG